MESPRLEAVGVELQDGRILADGSDLVVVESLWVSGCDVEGQLERGPRRGELLDDLGERIVGVGRPRTDTRPWQLESNR